MPGWTCPQDFDGCGGVDEDRSQASSRRRTSSSRDATGIPRSTATPQQYCSSPKWPHPSRLRGLRPGQHASWVSCRSPDPSVCAITYGVTNPFVQSMASNFEQALRLMEAAITDCPDDLWETDLWPDEASTGPTPHGGLHGSAPGSSRTTRCRRSTTTSPPSSGHGNHHNPLTRTPTPFRTVCSPRSNSSATSAGGQPSDMTQGAGL